MSRSTAATSLRGTLAVCVLISGMAAGGQPTVQASSPPSQACKLTQADMAANARLTFQEFDQQGVQPSTARSLGERACYAEAAAASEHYLVHGPILTDYQRNVVRWHLGQYLANAGMERDAARIVATTRREADPDRPDFDWNSYVVGTWAFLTKDRILLDTTYGQLRAKPGHADQTNARVLGRLSRCFRRPYREALEAKACEVR